MDARRVVITGLGQISPLGHTPEELWQALADRRSGVRDLAALGLAHHPVRVGGAAEAFRGKIDDFGELPPATKKAIRKGLKMMCREIELGVAAAQRAIHHAGDVQQAYEPERVGVVFGMDYITTHPDEFERGVAHCMQDQEFAYARWGAEGMPQVTPLWLLKYLPNMPASHLAIYNDFRGPSNSLTMREAAANAAIGEATAVIERGDADAILAGATGTRLHPLRSIHIALQETLHAGGDAAPETWSRPFDRNRTGTVLGEGAAAVMLESADQATARNATIWGEVLGFGSSMVPVDPAVAEPAKALVNAMQAALRNADLAPHDLGHINAHATGSVVGDIAEARAIRAALGDAADRIPVTAPKSYFGNLGAGSGMVELIASLLALHHGDLFPTLNCSELDPKCPICVPPLDQPTPAGQVAMNLSITPQGQATALIVSRAGTK